MYLISGEPGTGKTTIGVHCLEDGLENDETVLFIHGEESSAEVLDNAAQFETILEDRRSVTVESAIETKDGDRIPYEFTGGILEEDDGTVRGVTGIGRDITERKQREQQLNAERRRFQSLVDVLPHGVYRADPETLESTYVNDAFERIHGYSSDEWLDNADLWEQSLHPDDAATVEEAFHTHRESKEPGQLEYRIRTKDGAIRWIEDTFRWEYDDEGEITALVGVYTDITDRKEREQTLEERVKELTAIRETAHAFVRIDESLDDLFEDFIEQIPQSFQYPEVTASKIAYKDHEASTADFEPRENCLTSQMETTTGGTVRLDVVYLAERPAEDDGPFLTEEQELLDTLIAFIVSNVERWEYVQQLEQ